MWCAACGARRVVRGVWCALWCAACGAERVGAPPAPCLHVAFSLSTCLSPSTYRLPSPPSRRAAQGSATIFTSRGKTKHLFELRFDVEWTASVRANASKLCEGTLRCEASNTEGYPTLEAKAFLRTQVSSRDHGLRVVAVAEGGLKDEVVAAVRRFAAALAEKGEHG